MAPKSRPERGQDTPSYVYQWQIEKKKVSAGSVLALSTLQRCNLTIKTNVFSKMFTLHSCHFCLPSYHVETLKKPSKSIPKGFQKRSKTRFDVICILETLLEQVWNDLGLPKGSQKNVLEVSPRH